MDDPVLIVLRPVVSLIMVVLWYQGWSRRPRPLWPFLFFATALVFILMFDVPLGYTLAVNFAYLLASFYIDDDWWMRRKRQAKALSNSLTETARAVFQRQVREST